MCVAVNLGGAKPEVAVGAEDNKVHIYKLSENVLTEVRKYFLIIFKIFVFIDLYNLRIKNLFILFSKWMIRENKDKIVDCIKEFIFLMHSTRFLSFLYLSVR